MTIEWSATALAHLAGIYEYIARDSDIYARLTIKRIVNRVEQLREFPHSGRTLGDYQAHNLRELVLDPYRIIYQIGDHKVGIVAVVHGRQRFRLDD